MSDTKPEVQQEGVSGAPAKKGIGASILAHYKRWWWAHVIAIICVVIVVIFPVIYVAYPKIAQQDVNKATLNVTSLVFSDPTPDSIHVNQTQVLGNKGAYHPKIYAFNASLGIAGAPEPVSYVTVPETQSEDGQVIIVDATLQLHNSDATTNFTKTVLASKTWNLNVYGRPQLREMVLPKETVTFNKTIEMAGLNGLEGFSLTNVRVSIAPGPDGTNMNGTVNIPNPSVVTVPMGNLTLDISVNGTSVGQTFLNNLNLVPGANTYPVKSLIDNIKMLNFIHGDDAPYKDGVVPLDITGNRSVYHGQEISYFTEALRATSLRTSLNVSQVLIDSGLEELLDAL